MPSTSRIRLQIAAADKVLITGYPKSGKTELSTSLTRPVIHLDGFLERYGGEKLAAEQATKYLKTQAEWVAEGCMGYRMLNLGLEPNLIVLCLNIFGHGPWEKLIKGQDTLWDRYIGDSVPAVPTIIHYDG